MEDSISKLNLLNELFMNTYLKKLYTLALNIDSFF